MALIVLMVLLAASLAGLALGRRRAAAAALPAVPACALVLGVAAGAHLHRVVAEDLQARGA